MRCLVSAPAELALGLLPPGHPEKPLRKQLEILLRNLPVAAPVALVMALASPLALQGCGPSFEAIQEGDLRFAHCDRLDLDTHIAPSHRLHCWREWRRVYTYGQTRDRVDYAQRRIAEVVSGDPDPPFELPTGEAKRSDAVSPASPNPLHSPPPAVVPRPGVEPVAPEVEGVEPSCRAQCESSHATCAQGCESQPTGCAGCRSSLETCLGNCTTSEP
jgi:hypothetical protein